VVVSWHLPGEYNAEQSRQRHDQDWSLIKHKAEAILLQPACSVIKNWCLPVLEVKSVNWVSWGCTESYPVDIEGGGGLFIVIKQKAHVADHLHSPSAEVNVSGSVSPLSKRYNGLMLN
jgi:hypothetical protein